MLQPGKNKVCVKQTIGSYIVGQGKWLRKAVMPQMIVLFDNKSVTKYKLKVNNFPFDRECRGRDSNFEKINMFPFNRLAS